MTKNSSAKRNPLLQRATPLSFDNVHDEEIMALTPVQEADRFLSRWMEVIDPFVTYRKMFPAGGADEKRMLKEIKNFYMRLVLRENWTEEKYVTVINELLEARITVGLSSLLRFSELYEKQQLPTQIKARRAQRTRK